MKRFIPRGASGAFAAVRAVAAVVAVCVLVAGCDSRRNAASQSASAFAKGIAMLGDAPVGGHGGIQVYLAGTSQSARTDANGAFTVSGIPAGTYDFVAEKPGYNSVTIERQAVDPATHTQAKPLELKTVVLERAGGELTTAPKAKAFGSLRGEVTVIGAPTGENVRVMVDGSAIVTVSDEAGDWRLLNVEAGEYRLLFAKAGYKLARAAVKVEPEKDTVVPNVVLEQEVKAAAATPPTLAQPSPTPETTIEQEKLGGDRSIQGIVELTDEGGNALTAYDRVTVSLDNSDYILTPGDGGKFEFARLPAGLYTVLAQLDNGEPVKQLADVASVKSAQITLKLSEGGGAGAKGGQGNLTGRVVLQDMQGAALGDASGVSVGVSGTQYVALTGKDGRFRIEGVPSGSVTVLASKDGFDPGRIENLELTPGQTVDVGEIVLEPRRDYPRVISTSPADGTRDVTVGNELVVTVKFSKPMRAQSVREAVRIEPDGAWRAFFGTGAHPLANDSTLVIAFSNLDEQRPIKYDTRYRVTIAKSATDLEGTGMKQDYSFSFVTGGVGVVSTYPVDGDREGSVDAYGAPIVITFNTKLNTQSVDNRSIRIRPEPRVVPRIQIDTDPRTGWQTVMIYAEVKPETDYTVTVTRNVRASNGSMLSKTPYTFRFRTARPVMLDSVAPMPVYR